MIVSQAEKRSASQSKLAGEVKYLLAADCVMQAVACCHATESSVKLLTCSISNLEVGLLWLETCRHVQLFDWATAAIHYTVYEVFTAPQVPHKA
jgi:hypothetical protein